MSPARSRSLIEHTGYKLGSNRDESISGYCAVLDEFCEGEHPGIDAALRAASDAYRALQDGEGIYKSVRLQDVIDQTVSSSGFAAGIPEEAASCCARHNPVHADGCGATRVVSIC